MEIWTEKQDEKAIAILAGLPPNPFHFRLRQTNENEMQEQFETSGNLPIFEYKNANKLDAEQYITKLSVARKEINNLQMHPILKKLYFKKLDQLYLRAKIIEAVQNKDDKSVCELSKELYGSPEYSQKNLKEEFDLRLIAGKKAHIHPKTVNAGLFKEMIQKTLEYYGVLNWDIKITEIKGIRIKHGRHNKKPRILIPSNLAISKARAARMLTHEIEVHVLRTHNGLASQVHLLGRGLDSHTITDEGLAMYFQSLVVPNKLGFKPGFWDAWSTALALETDFKTTYQTIKQARLQLALVTGQENCEEKAKKIAWRLCLQAYRGITNTNSPAVAYTKGHIYRTGLMQIETTVQKFGKEIIPWLFAGNINQKHIEDIKQIEIGPGRTPDLIGENVVKSFFQ